METAKELEERRRKQDEIARSLHIVAFSLTLLFVLLWLFGFTN